MGCMYNTGIYGGRNAGSPSAMLRTTYDPKTAVCCRLCFRSYGATYRRVLYIAGQPDSVYGEHQSQA